jgi:Holliday junction DNA helicase RuvA
LYTYQHVREDDLRLFGFLSLEDLEIFKLLITVNGVGPKAGLAILTTYTRDDIVQAIQREDDRLFASVSGIGKKGAGKIVLDLKGKVGKASVATTGKVEQTSMLSNANDLVDAMVGLGYTEKEVYVRIKEVDETLPLKGQIKQMLGLLAK